MTDARTSRAAKPVAIIAGIIGDHDTLGVYLMPGRAQATAETIMARFHDAGLVIIEESWFEELTADE